MANVNALYKEYIEKMPDNIVTKKDIEEYEKEFWKTSKEKMKELKAKAKADAKAKPAKRKKPLDEEGNVKVRAPTAYNLFVKEQRAIVKKAHPELGNKEIFSEIAKLWKISKGAGNEQQAVEEMVYFEGEDSDDDDEDQ
jgi:hypothetical protein